MEIRRTQQLKRDIVERLRAEVDELDTPVLLLFSEGSISHVADELSFDLEKGGITVSVLSETIGAANSHFEQLCSSELGKLIKTEAVYSIDPRTRESDSSEEARERFEGLLMLWKKANPDGKIFVLLDLADILPPPDARGEWVVVRESSEGARIEISDYFVGVVADLVFAYALKGGGSAMLSSVLSPVDQDTAENPIRDCRKALFYTDIPKQKN